MDNQLPQAGFRPNRSTLDQVATFTEDIEYVFERNLKAGAVFVDLSDAYDTVWHRGLNLKLLTFIPDRNIVKLIMEIISNRTFRLNLRDKKVEEA